MTLAKRVNGALARFVKAFKLYAADPLIAAPRLNIRRSGQIPPILKSGRRFLLGRPRIR